MPHRPAQAQPGTRCQHPFCPVPIRLLWPIKAIRVQVIADVMRVTPPVIWRRSELLGIYDQRPRRRVVRVARPVFAAMWADRSLTLVAIGQAMGGLHPVNVSDLGRRLGLPPRIGGQKPRLTFGPEFTQMWQAGVLAREMARFYGCAQPTISKQVLALGLDQRLPQPGRRGLTLGEYLEAGYGRAMARSAAATRAALCDAQLADGPTPAQLAAERREKVRALRADGLTLDAMQAVLRISRSTLQSDIRALGLVGTSAFVMARQARAA